MGFLAWGRSWRVSAMINKLISLEFVVPTVLAVALVISLVISAVYSTDKYLLPVDQLEADYSVVGSQPIDSSSPAEASPGRRRCLSPREACYGSFGASRRQQFWLEQQT